MSNDSQHSNVENRFTSRQRSQFTSKTFSNKIRKRVDSTPGLNPGGGLPHVNSGFIALGGLKPLDEGYTTRPTLSILYASCDVCKVLNGGMWTSSLGSSFPIRSGMGDDDPPFLLLSSISLLLIYNKMAKKLEKKND